MKRLFIINPRAGGNTPRTIRDLTRFFSERAGAFEHRLCASWEEARAQTADALRAGTEQIVAVGGDGTVNAVVNGFFENGLALRPEARLAVSNTGTGSDYFRSIVCGARPAPDWREIVLNHRTKAVDIARIGDRFFANAASMGLGAEVVRAKAELPPWFPKKLSYAIPSLLQMMRKPVYSVRVLIDGNGGKEIETELTSAFFTKGRYLGGGMQVGGRAAPSFLDDGMLDVTLVSPMPLGRMLWKFRELYSSGLSEDSSITRIPGRLIRITSTKPIPFETDGELFNAPDPTRLEIDLQNRAVLLCTSP